MMYVDAHCHLGSRQFSSDREAMVGRMLAAGVRKAIIICCSRHDLEEGIVLRENNPGFKLALGIHPQDLEKDHSPERLERLRETIKTYSPDMIGEIGLDYYSHPHTKVYQKEFFVRQLQMAEEFGLPVNIHSRRAAADTLAVLREHPVRGIIHSYSGSAEMAALYIRLGYCISFGASVLFKGAKKPAEVIRSVPLNRMLIETDAPYQSPVRGERHEPKDVVRIYRAVSDIRQISEAELAEAAEQNFDGVFCRRRI